ncbi:MAG: iron-containing alcohol dehydrogenase [Verrucomicrobia bacterium]|nr:iron-containing alcohol dehydrogenase [Verrucomicrobiota bacterium]
MTSPTSDIALPPLGSFDHQPRTRLVFGVGAVERAGELARELSAKKALLVTDRGIVAAGHADRVRHALEAAGVSAVCYDQVEENPSTRCVDKCVAFARAAGIDAIIGLGGGSSLDTAKGCNFLLTNGGRMQDYWGVGKAKLPMLPLIAIPTTGGTGSECQSFALITDERTHQKMACGDPKAAARVAILDPALTLSQPARVTACTGIDAIAHAVETAVTRRRTALSLVFSREAFKLLVAGLPRVLASPDDLEARSHMLLGAAWAGTAIENSMLGAAHSAANPLTARFGLIHGQAVGMLLPHVVRFNARDPEVSRTYADLAVNAGVCSSTEASGAAAGRLAAHLQSLLTLAAMPPSLNDCGVKPEHLPSLAEEAAQQWTAQFNPRTVDAADFRGLYEAAHAKR